MYLKFIKPDRETAVQNRIESPIVCYSKIGKAKLFLKRDDGNKVRELLSCGKYIQFHGINNRLCDCGERDREKPGYGVFSN